MQHAVPAAGDMTGCSRGMRCDFSIFNDAAARLLVALLGDEWLHSLSPSRCMVLRGKQDQGPAYHRRTPIMRSAMQVGLALADTIENRFGRPKRVAGNDFVFQLYHKWGLGTLECQAGMLVVVEQSMSQVSMVISFAWHTGPGLSP